MTGNFTTSGAPEPFTIGDGAILEVAPPIVRRRSLLAGAAVGITTTALPRAAMAASPGTLEPSGAFTYPGDSEVLLYWTGFDSTSTPSQSGTAANSTSATGTHQRGGTNDGTTAVSAGGGGTFTAWSIQNPDNELSVTDAPVSPHLEWTIENTGSGTLEVSSLVLYRVRNLANSTDGDLRLAFYVSTTAGFASPTLRRTISLGHNLTRHIAVQLGLTGGSTLANGETAPVRAFPYRTSTSRDVRLIQHNSNDGDPLTALIAGPDDIQNSIVGYRSTSFGTPDTGDHTAAFIGRSLA